MNRVVNVFTLTRQNDLLSRNQDKTRITLIGGTVS
jgi:hypothetical protein